MYGIFTCIWWISIVNVGKYTIHGYYGYQNTNLDFRESSPVISRNLSCIPQVGSCGRNNLTKGIKIIT